MQIRSLGPGDAPAFQALRLRGLRECPTAFASSHEEESGAEIGDIAERLGADPNREILGAFEGSQLVGIVGVQRERPAKLAHKAVIWGMYVSPESRRRGIGRRLVRAALQRAFAMDGVLQVNLSVNAANAPAIALYRQAGFESFGVERGYMRVDGVLHDEMHMVCRDRLRRDKDWQPDAESRGS
jgi:ribosomal protein S18 acetylase RimI-like enzyme